MLFTFIITPPVGQSHRAKFLAKSLDQAKREAKRWAMRGSKIDFTGECQPEKK